MQTGAKLSSSLPDADKVLQGLGHLHVVDVQMPCTHMAAYVRFCTILPFQVQPHDTMQKLRYYRFQPAKAISPANRALARMGASDRQVCPALHLAMHGTGWGRGHRATGSRLKRRTRMQEIVNPRRLAATVGRVLVVEEGLRLRELVLMVRECQISSTRVDVQALAEDGTCHRAALYMPACAVRDYSAR